MNRFERYTHDGEGNFRKELEHVRHSGKGGGLVHMFSGKPLTFDELVAEHAKYHHEHPEDRSYDGSNDQPPTREQIALWLVESIEIDSVRVVLEPLGKSVLVALERITKHRNDLIANGHCMSDDDGWCDWTECPQRLDNEPGATGRHCPRDTAWRKKNDPDDEGRAGG